MYVLTHIQAVKGKLNNVLASSLSPNQQSLSRKMKFRAGGGRCCSVDSSSVSNVSCSCNDHVHLQEQLLTNYLPLLCRLLAGHWESQPPKFTSVRPAQTLSQIPPRQLHLSAQTSMEWPSMYGN